MDWLDEQPESEQIMVKVNHMADAKVYPGKIRIDFESVTKYDSATITLMNICEEVLSDQTSFTTYFDVNLDNERYLNLGENHLYFRIIGYVSDSNESSRIYNLEMLAGDQMGTVRYDLRRANSAEDSILIYNRHFLFLNSYYLKNRQ